MTLDFSKMHALGNDFMVIDGINQTVNLSPELIRNLADRHRGIGFDQCLILEPSQTPGIDFFYRIFNASGGEVGQCGNGARCIARFAHYRKLTDKKIIKVATKTTILSLELNDDDTVTVDFGKPKLEPESIPLAVKDEAISYNLPLKDGSFHAVYALSVGNPHALTLVNSIDNISLALGKEISEHSWFTEQTNAGFFEIIDSSTIRLRVYERGCGETQACGSGAVAAAAVAHLFHNLSSSIRVLLPGGELKVEWPSKLENIFLTGEAVFVYDGVIKKRV